MSSRTVAISVGGRFHSDHMFQGICSLPGVSAELYTTLPSSRFAQVPPEYIRSMISAEVIYRALQKLGTESLGDRIKMSLFGNFVASHLKKKGGVDLFVSWSSFGLEALEAKVATKSLVVRDSSHIEFQYAVLRDEYDRLKISFPERQFCLARELREYELADGIFVCSEFARRTFLARGFSPEKIKVLRLGVDTSLFSPGPEARITEPIKVVYFGILSIRKGVHHLLEATRDFDCSKLQLHLVGPVEPEFRPLLAQYRHHHYHPECVSRGWRVSFAIWTYLRCLAWRMVSVRWFHKPWQAAGMRGFRSMRIGRIDENAKNGFVVPAANPSALRELLSRFTRQPDLLPDIRHEVLRGRTCPTWGGISCPHQGAGQ